MAIYLEAPEKNSPDPSNLLMDSLTCMLSVLTSVLNPLLRLFCLH